jgi:hypothetical protein
MSDPERTIENLANETIAGLSATYDLVYVEYRDQLTDEQIAAVVRNDLDEFWELTSEFESDQRWESVQHIIREEGQMVLDRWAAQDDEDYDHLLGELEFTEDWERIREEIEDRDQGDWPMELAANSGSVLLRIAAPELDEDHAYFHEEVSAADVLLKLNMADTDHNLDTVQDALNNASPEFSLIMGYWVVGASVADLYELLGHGIETVEITNPHLYLGNPFMGSGFVTEKPVHGTITVPRSALLTDKEAFGSSLDDIYGGLNPSSFEAEIRKAS